MTDGTGPGYAIDDDVDADDQITAEDLAFAAADADDDETEIGHAEALAAMQAAFAALVESQGADILPTEGDEHNDIAVAGDAWTLYLSGWPGLATAFVAIEDEPADGASAESVEAAWRAVVPDPVVAALVLADMELEGALSTALRASGDPLSQSIADAIRVGADQG